MSPLGYLLTAKRLQIKDLDWGSFVAGPSFFFCSFSDILSGRAQFPMHLRDSGRLAPNAFFNNLYGFQMAGRQFPMNLSDCQ